MSIKLNEPINTDEFTGDMVRPFQLESSSLRGRIVRFHSVLDEILTPHQYPEAVNQLLGEMITLCSLLSSMLKFEGIFTLQTSSDGPIKMMVADMTSGGDIRGCASFHEDEIKKLKAKPSLFEALGKGYIAFTVDQGGETDRYQGIVELKEEGLVESVQHYFTQSEQIQTGVKITVDKQNGHWHSAGLMLQHMPQDGGTKAENVIDLNDEDWRRASVLLDTCTNDELLAPNLNSHDILVRLFHEEGVRVFEPIPLTHKCRCSDNKVSNVFAMMTEEEREEMTVDGKIILTCEFCSKDYEIDPETVAKQALDNKDD